MFALSDFIKALVNYVSGKRKKIESTRAPTHSISFNNVTPLKVHKREKFFVSDFEFFTIL